MFSQATASALVIQLHSAAKVILIQPTYFVLHPVIQNCIVAKVKLGKTISTAHALLHNQHVAFAMANPVQLIHATVM